MTTARDDALSALAIFARNELVKQPEVRQRLAHVADLRSLAYGPRENMPHRYARLDYWVKVKALSRDLEGVLTLIDIQHLTESWDETEQLLDAGWPLIGVGITGGRPGRDTTMTPEAAKLSVRSLALRPTPRGSWCGWMIFYRRRSRFGLRVRRCSSVP